MRRRWRIAAGIVVVASIGVVAGALTQLGPGGRVAAPTIQPGTTETSSSGSPQDPPVPPAGALVLAREAGRYGVAVEVEPRALTAIVLSPHGGGATGLQVSIQPGGRARPCGPGCYGVGVSTRPSSVRVLVAGAPPVDFAIPASTPPAPAVVARSARAMRGLRTLVYRERLASSPTNRIVTTWRLEAPDRLAYSIDTGVSGVVIGARRWDRTAPRAAWTESSQFPLVVMQPAWGAEALNPRLLGSGVVHGRAAWHVSFANPQIPGFFDAWIDRANGRVLALDMTAAAHFMHHDYLEFNRPLRISPPR